MLSYAKSKDYTEFEYYIDGGYSGKDLNRPAIQKLIESVIGTGDALPSLFIYAIVVTIVAVIVTVLIARVAAKMGVELGE